MDTNPWRILGIVGILIVVFALISTTAKADLQSELQGTFSDMINVTPGGAYDTQRRGVITGGGITARNRVVNPNLVSFIPPSLKAGCGGIDLFAGSFSYINAAQFNQLARNVAQGAVSYAFGLAIEGMCPTCAQIMSKLQSEIAKINALMRNSCDAAKAVVNSTGLKGWRDKEVKDAAAKNQEWGFMSDYFESSEKSPAAGVSPAKTAIINGHINDITGNIVYDSIVGANASAWFASGDQQMEEVLMSLTGTAITTSRPDNSDVQYDYRPPIIKIKQFLEGGQVIVYKCEAPQCLLPEGNNKQTITIEGLRTKARKMVFGSGTCKTCAGGILRKMTSRNAGDLFTADEKKFIEATSPGVYGLLRRMSPEMQTAALMADRMIDIVAVELASRMIADMFDAVTSAVKIKGKALDTFMMKDMKETLEQVNEERRVSAEAVAGVNMLINLEESIVNKMRAVVSLKTH